ncbi:MAG: proteasome beta-type subunit [Actinomycetota bacterium]|jgi:proteasome beta subunit
MSLSIFGPTDGPGPDFLELVRRAGALPGPASWSDALGVPHATTCVAMRYADGVLMAGDRRATSGNWISHREMEKVVQADRFSGVAISGAAGPAMEMIKLFALSLEHYEKIEGRSLSLEGKANYLSTIVRQNLPAAMQGMVVVPLFAGFEPREGEGRLWDYDATGGRYEERDVVTAGSGSLHAGTVVKVGWRRAMTRDDAVVLACRALWEAAEADSATGGPDVLRGVYPIVATITADGWRRLDDTELARVYAAIAEEVRTR